MYISESNYAKASRARWNLLKSIVVAFAAFFEIALGSPTSATLIEYRVEGVFDSGSLAGRNYLEVFSFNDSSKPDAIGGIPWTTQILSYSLDVEGVAKHFTVDDWTLEHTFSQFIGGRGLLNTRAFLSTPGPLGDPPGEPPAFSEFLDDGLVPIPRQKRIKWYDWSKWNTVATDSSDLDPIVTITSISEPPSIAIWSLFSMLLFGLHRNARR